VFVLLFFWSLCSLSSSICDFSLPLCYLQTFLSAILKSSEKESTWSFVLEKGWHVLQRWTVFITSPFQVAYIALRPWINSYRFINVAKNNTKLALHRFVSDNSYCCRVSWSRDQNRVYLIIFNHIVWIGTTQLRFG
jgi:hypothetical protein